jgi:predicted ATPase/signal transduction histidine kinase/GAF domain-containing protein/tRNA A-37 threonylcarbamoyl transferase component Bud32
MTSLSDFLIKEKIHESSTSLVHRGVRQLDACPVVLKVLKPDYPTPTALARYTHEYDITRSLNLEGVIRAYGLQNHERTLVMILEDFGGESLERWIQRSPVQYCPMSLHEWLRLSIQLTEILGQIHTANVIHKDINPSNIVVNPETGVVKIIDFGISTRFSYTTPTFQNSGVLEGTLAYLSPEQTGRMNRLLDYRTDFYSLGVTLYQLLTGRLPFDSTHVLELIHCHIAKQPVLPEEINSGIPPIISQLVMKLMAKNAEDRYQSALGVQADLEHCLRQLEMGDRIESFPLGLHDVNDKFQIPQKLYGREVEIETLLAAFEGVDEWESGRVNEWESGRVNDYPSPHLPIPPSTPGKLMLVSGYSGVGKSALVQEIYKPITQKQGYFISGKFDQFQRDIPYTAIVSALQSFVRQLLMEPESQLQQWRDRFLTALGANGQLMVDLIPELELIIGKQHPVEAVGSTEAKNRFNAVFQNFIRALCSYDRPLVIFLDDLHWADLATLKLIERMMTNGELRSLLLIGAYRNNEVNSTHPLMLTLEQLKREDIAIDQITLTPLKLEAIAQLIAETLHTSTTKAQPLAELVLSKTGGNPFFINEFLRMLYAEQLICFNPDHRSWEWQINQIEAKEMTENVVELLIDKLRQLPRSTQQVLNLAACIGTEFRLTTLTTICEKSASEMLTDLLTAVQVNLILPISKSDEDALEQHYKFLHDRVQQAAYALTDEQQKQAIHLQIGRSLLQKYSSNEQQEQLFTIVDHLNISLQPAIHHSSQPIDPVEQIQFAQLNLLAGQKAKAATAYRAALSYLTAGMTWLTPDSWQHHYDLTLALHQEITEAAYLCGEFEQMEHWAAIVLQNAHEVLHTVKIYQVKIQAAIAQVKLEEAIQIGLFVLEQLGLSLPEAPSQAEAQTALNETIARLAEQDIQALLELPDMTEPHSLAIMDIILNMMPLTYYGVPNLFVLITLVSVNLSIQYGNATCSAYCYVCYAIILCWIVQDIETSYQYGKLALSLAECCQSKWLKARATMAFRVCVMLFQEHLRTTIPALQEAYRNTAETGDFEFIGFYPFYECLYLYCVGQELTQLEQKLAINQQLIRQVRREGVLNWLSILWQTVLNLLGRNEIPDQLVGEAYDEQQSLSRAISASDRGEVHFYYLNRLILSYLFGEFEQAANHAALAERYLDGMPANLTVTQFYFYDSLASLSQSSEVTPLERERWLNRVNQNQEKMHRWAHHAPMNFLHKYHLVEAEKNRVLGYFFEAEELYEQAIQGAQENEYLQEEALAYELAAKHYLHRGRNKIAQTYFREAHYCYTRWGAIAKVNALEAQYPQFFSQATQTSTKPTTTGSTSNGSVLDLATVMKASQAISGEIELEQLLNSLMKILIENAGAQRGCLILDSAGTWMIKAVDEVISGVDGNPTIVSTTQIPQSILIDGHVPVSIIHYVERTKESVVLHDAIQDQNFSNDPYIQLHQTRSILCTPLLNQGQLKGIVYLENATTVGAFTTDRLEVIQLLAGQAAIALTNAKLYAEIRAREDQLSQFVNAVPIGVMVVDVQGKVCYANQMADELCSMDLLHECATPELLQRLQIYRAGTNQLYSVEQIPILRSLAGETVHVSDMEFRRPDQVIAVEVTSTPVFDDAGQVRYAIAAFQDITQRKQAERLLKSYSRILERQVRERTQRLKLLSEQLLEHNARLTSEIAERERVELALRQKEGLNLAIITTIPDLLIRMDRHGNYLGIFANENLILYKPEQNRVGANLYDVLPHNTAEEYMHYIQRALQTGELQVFENQLTINGVVHYFESRIAPSEEDEVLIIERDFTEQRNATLRERKQTEEALILKERNRLAREIHDTLAQAFTGIVVHLEAAALKAIEDPQMAQRCIETSSELARFGLAEARRSVQALRLQLLTEGDLCRALHRMSEQLFPSTQTQIAIELTGEVYSLPAEVENNLLRIGQEALTNAAKYARATEIQIALVYEPTQCTLSIQDNGQGFDVSPAFVNHGFGLLGMTERAKQIGAQLTIQSTPGSGTEIVVSVNRRGHHEQQDSSLDSR